MSTTRRVFPEVFKREAVDRVISSGLPVGCLVAPEAARRLHVLEFGKIDVADRPQRPRWGALRKVLRQQPFR